MRVIAIFTVIFILTSCQIKRSEEEPTKKLAPEPLENYYHRSFDDAFFKENHFDYTPDSAKHYFSSETIVLFDHSNQYLRDCSAKLVNDSLSLKFTDNPFSKNAYDLRCFKLLHGDGRVFLKLFLGGDTIHQVPIYTFIALNLLLDKEIYKKGDSLKGKIALSALAWPLIKNESVKDTLSIYGLIKTKVE